MMINDRILERAEVYEARATVNQARARAMIEGAAIHIPGTDAARDRCNRLRLIEEALQRARQFYRTCDLLRGCAALCDDEADARAHAWRLLLAAASSAGMDCDPIEAKAHKAAALFLDRM